MKTIKMEWEPVFPLKLKRERWVRNEWVNGGKTAFTVHTPRSKTVCATTAPPEVVNNGRQITLVIHAAPVYVLAEVWDNTNKPCRLWFEFNGTCYMASRLSGFKPKQEEPPLRCNKASNEATKLAAESAAML